MDEWSSYQGRYYSKCTAAHCPAKYAASTGNSTLIGHVINAHPAKYERLNSKQHAYEEDTLNTEGGPSTCMTTTTPTPSSSDQQSIANAFHIIASKEFPEVLAKAFAMNSLPTNLINQPSFRKLLESCRSLPSNYRICHRDTLTKHISSLSERIREKVLERVRGPPITLGADGWTNTRRDAVTNIVALANKRAYYWTSVVNSDQHNTSEWLFNNIEPIVDDMINKKKIKVIALAVDNAAVMCAFVKLMQHKYPFIVHVPCAAHTLQLVVRRILDISMISDVVDQAVGIIDKFHSNKVYRLKLRQLQQTMGDKDKVVLKPNTTRWNSMYYAIDRLIDIRNHITSIMVNFNMPHLVDAVFWDKLVALLALLQPFRTLTDALQSDKATLSDVYTGFEKVYTGLDTHKAGLLGPCVDEAKQAMYDRWISTAKQPCVQAIIILTTRISILTKNYGVDQLIQGQQFIVDWGVKYGKQYNPTISSVRLNVQLAQYLGTGGHFQNVEMVRESYPDYDLFWSYYTLIAPELSEVARALLSITASEASVERTFSAQGLVHSDLRNRMTDDKIEDEMFIKFNERALSSVVVDPDECERLEPDNVSS